ncbi:MAG: ABC transporter permease [Anaerolineales bacterium]|jgi:lipopolysaccharide transport system permease protein|nr:ABC transporter permease [Anaerolineales bacterium]WKZ41462.1 MAG: ABC transporter permease [Anaerolineales bacterium]
MVESFSRICIKPTHMDSFLSPPSFRTFYSNRDLILNLTRREIQGRYRGSLIGVLWSFLTPLLMLAIYTFVFSVVFQARWGGDEASRTDFALILFAGLMIFNLFSETINRAPGLVLGNANYVKKVVFPLEILPVVSLGTAIFQLSISFIVWLLFFIIFRGVPPLTIFLLPLVLLPFFLIVLGISWMLASLGVYVRDVNQIIGVLVTVSMFLSPLFYSISALPEQFQVFMMLNPLTFVIEQARQVMIWGEGIRWMGWGIYCLVSLLIAWVGFIWFMKTKKGFADVI